MKLLYVKIAAQTSSLIAISIAALFLTRRIGFVPPPVVEAFQSANTLLLYFSMSAAMISAAYFWFEYFKEKAKEDAKLVMRSRITKGK